MYKGVLILSALLAISGCSSIRSSSMGTSTRPAYTGHVQIVMTVEPADAEQLGLIQASGIREPLAEIAVAFQREAANLGGNVAKVDRVATTYEMVTSMQTQSYSCGTTNNPRTCTRQVQTTSEVATTTLTGRAFRTRDITQ